MAVENPPPLTPLATAAPQRGNRATFSLLVDAFVTWLIAAVLQFKALGQNVWHNATEAYGSALAAAMSQGAASASASAAGAAAGDAHDLADAAAASASAAGLSATAAAGSAGAALANATSIAQMGASVLAHAALAGLPTLAGQRLKGVRVNADESGLEMAEFVTAVKAYEDRADLRAIAGGLVATRYLVRRLGLFEWQAGSVEPDDDATSFRTVGGAWIMIAADPDFAAECWLSELPLRLRFNMTLTSIAGNAAVDITVPAPGVAVGDWVAVIPVVALPVGLSVSGVVSAAGTVSVRLSNSFTSTSIALTPGYWGLQVTKQ